MMPRLSEGAQHQKLSLTVNKPARWPMVACFLPFGDCGAKSVLDLGANTPCVTGRIWRCGVPYTVCNTHNTSNTISSTYWPLKVQDLSLEQSLTSHRDMISLCIFEHIAVFAMRPFIFWYILCKRPMCGNLEVDACKKQNKWNINEIAW